jgi:DNA invertase Pin-like site-specific DNA recombinase
MDIVVVYKVDRPTRSLADFARLVELFDAEGVSFVSVTQQVQYGELGCVRRAKEEADRFARNAARQRMAPSAAANPSRAVFSTRSSLHGALEPNLHRQDSAQG